MLIDQTVYAIVDPATDRILGDGDGCALYESPPRDADVTWVRDLCECPAAVVVPVVIHRQTQSSP